MIDITFGLAHADSGTTVMVPTYIPAGRNMRVTTPRADAVVSNSSRVHGVIREEQLDTTVRADTIRAITTNHKLTVVFNP